MDSNTKTEKRPLKRYFKVKLSKNEAINLKQYPKTSPNLGYINGQPHIFKKRNGIYIAKIFRRFGITDGSTTAIGKIRLVSDDEANVVIRSGLAMGYFMLTICILFTIALITFLLLPAVTEELELNLFALVIGIGIFAFMSWIFLSRYMRESDLNKMEEYLREKIGGEWSSVTNID